MFSQRLREGIKRIGDFMRMNLDEESKKNTNNLDVHTVCSTMVVCFFKHQTSKIKRNKQPWTLLLTDS